MAVARPPDEELKAQFLELDENKDGMLSYDELVKMLKKGNPGISDTECETLWRQCDKDASGLVDFDEFVDFLYTGAGTGTPKKPAAKKMKDDADWEAAIQTFIAYAGFFQAEGDDQLNLRELTSMLKDLYIIDEKFTEEDCEKVFKKCKKKRAKAITALQFRKVVKLIAKKKEKPVSLILKFIGASSGPKVTYAGRQLRYAKRAEAEGYDLSFLDDRLRGGSSFG